MIIQLYLDDTFFILVNACIPMKNPDPSGVADFDTKMVTCEFCLKFCPVAKRLHFMMSLC